MDNDERLEQPQLSQEATAGTGSVREDDTEHAARTRPFLQPPPPRRAPTTPVDIPPIPAPAPMPRRARPESSSRRGYTPPPAAPPPAPPAPDAARRGRSRRSATPPSQSGLYLPWWSLVVMVAVVAVLTVGVVMVFATLTQPASLGDQAPRVMVITSQPTLSQDFAAPAPGAQAQGESLWPTAIRAAEPTPTAVLPTLAPSPSLPPGEFALGVRVEVIGVGGSGLNIRPAPTTRGDPLFLAQEGDTFAIVGGPQNADGIEWWKIEDPRNSERSGWAARNYLTVVVQ